MHLLFLFYLGIKYKNYYSSSMFSTGLEYLNILVMLVLAFISFKAYQSNTLAIQSQP